MRNRLILYWVVLILSLFSAALLILSILGVMPGAGLKVLQTLMIQQQNTQLVIVKQTDSMMARGIALSEEVTKILTNKLTSKGMTFSDINDNPEFIKELEQSMYPILKSALDIQYCSGAFIVLDATVNTKTDIADTSRMGLYLRLSDLKTVNTYNQHMVYFCGNPDIAREQKVELHNWWNLEFDTKDLLGYQQVMQHKENRLVESCIWTERLILKDT